MEELSFVRLILFDADNTVLDFDKSERCALRECLRRRGIPAGREQLLLYHRINDECWKRLERGEIERSALLTERFRTFFAAIGYDGDPAAMQKDYGEALSRKMYRMPYACSVLRALARRYPLYLVTNGNTKTQHGRLDRNPVRRYFRQVFISEEIGADKPSPLFFDRVFEAIRKEGVEAEPGHAFLVGDSPTSDIAGARRYGICTCLYSPSGAGEISCGQDYTISDLRELWTLFGG